MPDRGGSLRRAQALVEAYLQQVREAERKRKPGEGIFGTRGGVRDDPCHDRFAQDLERLLSEVRAETPDSAELRELLSYLFAAPKQEAVPGSAYWMLLAAHGLTQPLVDALSPEDAAALAEAYAAAYPRRERFPVQRELLKAMQARGGVKPRVRRLF